MGLAHAARLKGDDVVALAMVGDGGTSEGDFHEALNFAAVWQAPVVFLVQNNGFAISVPLAKQTAAPSLAHKAVGYGMPGRLVDGNDAAAVHEVLSDAVRHARAGGGPTLVEAITYRVDAHTNADDATRYRGDAEVETWREHDPIQLLERELTERGLLDEAGKQAARDAAEAIGRRPARAHEPGPGARPHGPVRPRLRRAHTPTARATGPAAGRAGGRERVGGDAPMTTVAVKPATMAQALTRALRDAMAADPAVHVMGEDVGTLGGVFRVTDGLAKEFGEDRCTDTPLAEAGILGTAVGMAMYGLRPVVEMQFDAFAYPAFEQLISHVSRMRNRTRGTMPLPITIRVPYGGGIGGVEHHSDSSEAYYMATPGLHVVTPATVADAYGLLRAAITSDDPVVFLEPKRLYWSKDSWNPEEPTPVEPIGRAVVRRSGRSATLITYGPSVPVCMEAAEAARAEGWDLEVVDLRSLVPFDDETVCASVRRTGRAVVVHESGSFGGPGGEIAARVTERCFHHLEAPVLRVAGFDVPYPPPMLERHHLPGVDRILDAVGRLQWEAES
ncbi:putative 3-methyl-2-oxobutanoate dehydrogenase subunit beta [Streptomyces afghaniensis 772]|uniref:Putative 3-methyl-2-oxobutanoate dehydrogenase subunit beta n=2 Tax=Streptomyces TaxID=1883 RepID=S4MZ19_9ACTN|nr:putative 3-methyl-2-oxobutanoate dehydrogenase subunit beta [Streptomyces afghaniensis 772]